MRVDSHTQIRQAMRVLIHTHISCRLLVEGNAPKPLLNTEFHSAAARSSNAFSPIPGALFRGIGCRETQHPLVLFRCPKIGLPLEAGVAKYHPSFFFPRRWRRLQRCWEYPSKHRRDRCERRALLNYFKYRRFYHHVSQSDAPSSVFGFVLVSYLMLFQQAASIYIQMFGEPVYRHIRLNRLG